MSSLNRDRLERALRAYVADLDYDVHKTIECGEEDGENHYPEHVDTFLHFWEHAGQDTATSRVLTEIAAERAAQDAIFGQQDLPDGTGTATYRLQADDKRFLCDRAFKQGVGTFRHVFLEEVYEALAESDPAKLRAELVQAVAVGVKWIEAIDRRSA